MLGDNVIHQLNTTLYLLTFCNTANIPCVCQASTVFFFLFRGYIPYMTNYEYCCMNCGTESINKKPASKSECTMILCNRVKCGVWHQRWLVTAYVIVTRGALWVQYLANICHLTWHHQCIMAQKLIMRTSIAMEAEGINQIQEVRHHIQFGS